MDGCGDFITFSLVQMCQVTYEDEALLSWCIQETPPTPLALLSGATVCVCVRIFLSK